MRRVTPFLMFTGKAEEALRFYASTFSRSRIISFKQWGADGPGVPGTVYQARLEIGEIELMVFDSPPGHDFTFTPSISFMVDCDSPDEVRELAVKLGEGGQMMMPVDRYPFAELFCWVSDRYGISWQLRFETS